MQWSSNESAEYICIYKYTEEIYRRQAELIFSGDRPWKRWYVSPLVPSRRHLAVRNPLFQRLLDHYGVISIPARPHHPKDKPLVEGAVNGVYRQIMARLAGQVFADRATMLKLGAATRSGSTTPRSRSSREAATAGS
jgi:hypothetical protein